MNTIDLATEDNLQYTFYPVNSGSVSFMVKAANDAHIALTTGPEESDPMVEVFIGGWGNTKSVIRRNRTKPDKVEVETPAILHGDEFRTFWIRWNAGIIMAGREGEAAPFISWEDPEPFPINHVGVCTGWGASGLWKIDGKYDIQTEDNLQYQFTPAISGNLDFEFKGPSNCHVTLTRGPCETDPMYEFIIGGWDNKKSVIRHRQQKPDKVTVDTDGIVSHGEFRRFLIQWQAGRLIVRSSDGAVIMEWVDPDPFTITHFGVRTGWGATGQWKIFNCGGQMAPIRVPPSSGAPTAMPMTMPSGGPGCWVDCRGSEVNPEGIVGGEDNGPLYIGRAEHEGALIPGKVVPSHGVCYVAWGGAEHPKSDYQMLCRTSCSWVPTSGAHIPSTAVPGGQTEEMEPLFIGRVNHEGTVTIGKVQPSHGVCYIPYGGEELSFPDYEVLVSM